MEISYNKEDGKFKASITPTSTIGKITMYTAIFLAFAWVVKRIIN